MSKVWILIIIAIVVLVGGYYLFLPKMINYTPSGAPTNTNTPTASPSSNMVTIQNFAFNPSSLTVPVGTTVIWTNQDTAPHTITADIFKSNTLQPGDSFSHTFNQAGSFSYHCSIHPFMTGTVTVQ